MDKAQKREAQDAAMFAELEDKLRAAAPSIVNGLLDVLAGRKQIIVTTSHVGSNLVSTLRIESAIEPFSEVEGDPI